MKKLNNLFYEIVYGMYDLPDKGDLSDLGNVIGIVIAKHFTEKDGLDNFIAGLKHGVSLTDGTHDNPKKKKKKK